MFLCITLNTILLVDLILHLIYYGPKTIIKLKKMYVWEALLQIAFMICTFMYFSYDLNQLDK